MQGDVVVAGHICLDIIPAIPHGSVAIEPGRLVEVGQAVLATGGPVSNTGLSLHKLGVPVRLIGKVGDDLFGSAVRDIFSRLDPRLPANLVVASGEITSYSVVISPPGVDRTFLHAPGCNDTFLASDVPAPLVQGASIVHFGYPPLMKRMYEHGGRELVELVRTLKAQSVVTTLDMSLPDPTSEAGRADWPSILRATLPWVDAFLPSAEECLFLFERARYLELAGTHGAAGVAQTMTLADFRRLADTALGFGTLVVALKAGARGLYVKTGDCDGLGLPEWSERELLAPCLMADVVGTTGSGDATIAGFLMALREGWPLESAMVAATAAGACCVEAADSVSGVRPWSETDARLDAGWVRCPARLDEPGWTEDPHTRVWHRV